MSQPKTSRFSRTIQYFRETDLDEARAAMGLVKEVMDERLKDAGRAKPKLKRGRKAKVQGQDAGAGQGQAATASA